MNPRLVNIMKVEVELLEILLNLLEEQYNLLIGTEKDVVKISELADKIDVQIKEIANLEIEKRDILKQKSLKDVVNKSNDKELLDLYDKTLILLDKIALQKDTNSSFIKQQLFFTKNMIRAITPRKNAEIYDNNGKIKK